MARECPTCGEVSAAESTSFCSSCGLALASAARQDLGDLRESLSAGRGEPGRCRSKRRWPRAATLALSAVVAGAGGVLAGLHGSGSPEPSRTPIASVTSPSPSRSGPAERSELAQIAAIVQESATARSQSVPAVGDVQNCTAGPAAGIRQLDQAISKRQGALGQAARVQTGAIPDGQQLARTLLRLLRLSASADQQYRAWMQHIPAGAACPVSTQDPAYQAGSHISLQATNAKKRFARLWNQLAADSGQPAFNPGAI